MLRSIPPPLDPIGYRDQLDRAFGDAWCFLEDTYSLEGETRQCPVTLQPGSLDEPLLLTRPDDGEIFACSNVCTHRGALLADCASSARSLRCPYHGRRFDLRGRVVAAPGFETVAGFPSEGDHLATVPVEKIGPILFTSLASTPPPWSEMRELFDRHLGFLPLEKLVPDPEDTRNYSFDAHWTLWCDNYLEGFHIPYVHPALARVIDPNDYRIVLGERTSMQYGIATGDEPFFTLPEGHPEAGIPVGAYYLFLYPGTTLNFYPWGMSLNVIRPESPSRTTIHYRSYVMDASLRKRGAGGALDTVEKEDDDIVERAHRGVRSRLYRPGRFAPKHEAAVEHFQGWLRARA